MYPVKTTSSDNGNIVPSGVSYIVPGSDVIINLNPNKGYRVGKVVCDGKDVTKKVNHISTKPTLTLKNVQDKHSVTVDFVKVIRKK